MTDPSAKSHERYEWIDLARFAAAMSVVLYHYLFRGWQHSEFFSVSFESTGTWFRFGYLGVNLFFMISGFVILLSCDGKNHRDFVISRAVRLYPAYVVAVLLTWCVTAVWGTPNIQTSAAEMLVNLTMLQQFVRVRNVDGVYWTLARELIFYAMVFCFLFFQKLKRFELYLWAWLALSVILVLGPLHRFLIYATNSDYSGFFAFGAALYFVKRYGSSPSRIALACVAFAVLNLQGVLESSRMEQSTGLPHPAWIVIAINTLASLGLAYVVLANAQLGRLRTIGLNLGLISYPLYLLHAHIGYVVFSQFSTPEHKYLVFAAMVLCSIALATAVTFLWERPIQRKLRAALTRRLPTGP